MTEIETPDEDPESVEVESEIIQKSEAEQIVTGAALIPDNPDKEGDVVDAENVKHVAYDYLATHQKVDENHDRRAREHDVVESYVAPQEIEIGDDTVPEGTWIVSVRLGDEAWQKVEKGLYTGFSVDGMAWKHV
jgi:hypothetical protein